VFDCLTPLAGRIDQLAPPELPGLIAAYRSWIRSRPLAAKPRLLMLRCKALTMPEGDRRSRP